MGDDADGHELLAVVAAVHHERVGEALDDGALGLAEALGGISSGGVWKVDGLSDLDVVAIPLISACCPFRLSLTLDLRVREGDVADLDVLVAPLVEQLGAANLAGHVLGQHRVAGGLLDLDLAVRHVGGGVFCDTSCGGARRRRPEGEIVDVEVVVLSRDVKWCAPNSGILPVSAARRRLRFGLRIPSGRLGAHF